MARAGNLRDRATFQSEIRTPDGAGGSSTSWGNDLAVWAQFLPERGRERLEAGRLEAAVAGVLRVRSTSETRAVTEAHTVTIDGVRYQIRSITNPDRRNILLEMVIDRGVAT